MARLTECKTCHATISDQAMACPQCGQPLRSTHRGPGFGAYIIVLVLGYLLYVFLRGATDNSSAAVADTRASITPSDAECQQTLACAGDRYLYDAAGPCKRAITKQALHAVKWEDGIGNPTFRKFMWADETAHTLRYIGDKVEFQNGFSAWTPMIYLCDYDPATRTVLDTHVYEGRL